MRNPLKKQRDSQAPANDRKAASPSQRQTMTKQLKTLYELTSASDSKIGLILAASFFIPLIIGAVLAFTVGPWPVFLIMGLLIGAIITMFVFTRRAQRAAFSQVHGQPGATGAALGMTRGWSVEQEPIAIDPRTQDMVFRASGRGGVALITEGPTGRVKKLVDGERKRLSRVAPNAPVTVINAGDGEGQVPLQKLNRELTKIRRTLSKEEAAALTSRLKSLGGMRPVVPRGIDPAMVKASARRMRRG